MRRCTIPCLAIGAFLATCLAAASAGAEETETMDLRRSDVVFMGYSEPEVCRQYGATVISWGSRPWRDDEGSINWFQKRVKEAHALGIRYLPGAAFRTAFAQMIDYEPNFEDAICRSLEGKPILVPWLWDHEHKGHPAYWFCTNSPAYRDYLKHQMKNAFLIDVEGLHIDDYAGTSGTRWAGGGCFCRHCVAAFREHLKENVPREKLAELGIESLDAFDYGQFLRDSGVTAEQYKREAAWHPERLPLSHEYENFQRRRSTEWVAQYRRWAEEQAGHRLALCVNSGVSGGDSLLIAPFVTFFSGEVGHEAESGQVSPKPVWSFKLGDAVGRPVACTGAGWDWAFVNEQNKPGLVRTWIAQAYAFGHQFMPPVHQWCYTKEKGSHWYDAPPEELAYVCRFVRENAGLFDGYDAVAHVGLLYSNAASRRWQQQAADACAELVLMNVPFRLVLAGDDQMDARLESEDLKDLKALVVSEPLYLDADQQAVLDGAKDVTVEWKEGDWASDSLPRYVTVEGASNVTAVPRAESGDVSAPFVCHLVNRNYVLESDSMAVQRDFAVILSDSLFGAGIAGATLHAPRNAPVTLKAERVDAGTRIIVPELDLWAVLELERAGTDR